MFSDRPNDEAPEALLYQQVQSVIQNLKERKIETSQFQGPMNDFLSFGLVIHNHPRLGNMLVFFAKDRFPNWAACVLKCADQDYVFHNLGVGELHGELWKISGSQYRISETMDNLPKCGKLCELSMNTTRSSSL